VKLNCSSASREISPASGNPVVHYRVHNIKPTVPIPNQIIAVYFLPVYISFQLCQGSSCGHLPSVFPTKNLSSLPQASLASIIQIFLHLITQIRGQHKLRRICRWFIPVMCIYKHHKRYNVYMSHTTKPFFNARHPDVFLIVTYDI
jgi:hypothetical protein